MYETYFNLTERPFASVPRIDHYYPAAVIDSSRKTLTRCIDRGEGVAMIIGPSGVGKSLLCQLLAEQFQKTFQVALLASTHLDTRRSLLQAILYELSRPYRGMDEGELRLALADYITLSDDCNRGLVLLVDEAHHLPLRLLDEIRSLTNLTRDFQPAVRTVLAGSHALEERFASPKLESFSQRISARCYLETLQRSETQAYIHARVSACGGRGDELFPPETCQMVHKATDGVPRLINQVCDHVLLLAYAAGIRRIEPAHAEEAWADLQQLPTPWSEPAAPTSDNVIEFGGLDDAPLEVSPIAGKIAAAEEQGPMETIPVEMPEREFAVVAESASESQDDPQTFAQLRQIQKLLADIQAEFQPTAINGPEVELVFETPHPFAEPFEEEEMVVDRYAALQAASIVAMAESAPTVAAVAESDSATKATEATVEESRVVSPPETTAPQPESELLPAVAAITSSQEAEPVTFDESRDLRPVETIPMPHDRTAARKAGRELEVAACAAVVEEPPPRPKRSAVPPPRQEFGRLFARLRRGL